MSRSRKKTPVCGMTTAKSEKDDKKRWHRKARRLRKQSDEVILDKEVSDVWSMAKDGKQYLSKKTLDRHPDLVRK